MEDRQLSGGAGDEDEVHEPASSPCYAHEFEDWAPQPVEATAPMLLQLSTWPEIEKYLERSKGMIVPVGSTEQHGPNGLIGTDAICPQAIAEGVSRRIGILVGPALSLGVAPFNLDFPGTVSLRAGTMMAVVTDYVRSLVHQGFERFFFLNGHGGNIAALRAAFSDIHAALDLARDPAAARLRLRLRSWWELPAADRLRKQLYGEHEGLHATPSEIAITRHVHPDLVRDVEMQPAATVSAAFMRAHAGDAHDGASEHRRRFPDGRIGSDPTLATAEHGRKLLQAAVIDASDELEKFLLEA